MKDFYICIHSDASTKSFPDNKSGCFKTILPQEYDLGNMEYNVAVSSITRYYETSLEDMVFIREKRAAGKPAVTSAGLTVQSTYPESVNKVAIEAKHAEMLADGNPVLAYKDGALGSCTIKFTVEKSSMVDKVFKSTITKNDLKQTFTGSSLHKMQYTMSDLLGVGLLTVKLNGILTDPITKLDFSIEFQDNLKNILQLPQTTYKGSLTNEKRQQVITLRDAAPEEWEDLRTTLEYVWQVDGTLQLFEKKNQALKYYLDILKQLKQLKQLKRFYGNTKSVTLWNAVGYSYVLHQNIAKLFHLPEIIDGQSQSVQVSGEVSKTFVLGKKHFESATALEDYFKKYLILPEPHKLTFTRKDDEFSFVISEGVKLSLPHALASYTFKFAQTSSEWNAKIYYYDDESLARITKEFKVPYKRANLFAAQASALQTATQAAFKAIATEEEEKAHVKDSTYTKGTLELPFQIRRAANESVITSIDIAEGYELEIPAGLAAQLKIKRNIATSNLNEFAWIACDLVRQTVVGEQGMRLLTPTPVKVTTNSIGRLEYVPVEIKKFSIIEIKMYTNLRTMELFEGPYNILIVLHFKPTYKRKGTYYDDDISDSKRHCDGCSSRILQQASTWGLNETWTSRSE